MKLTFILPTCEPNMMFKFLLPSISYLKPIKSFIEFNICFQPPYTKKEITRVLEEFKKCHIKVNYMFKDYKITRPYTPLIRMRNDCAMMSSNSDIYGLLDDDMSFEAASICSEIRTMISRFEHESKLAVISFYNDSEPNFRENFYSTNAGLFYRGGKYYGFKGLMPEYLTDFNKKIYTRAPYGHENLLELFGGHQDKFCAMVRLATGDYGDCMLAIPVNHLENRLEEGSKSHGWKDAEVLDGSITWFILKYFNDRFVETHGLTLFNKDLDCLIYPYKYDCAGNIKAEFDLYNEHGLLKNGAKFKLYWKVKKYTKYLDYFNKNNLTEHLPKELLNYIEKVIEDAKKQK